MTNDKEHNSHNFWSGFSLGIAAGGVLMYAFATKRGRDGVQKMLKNTETLEHNIEGILEMIQKSDIFSEEKEQKKEEK